MANSSTFDALKTGSNEPGEPSSQGQTRNSLSLSVVALAAMAVVLIQCLTPIATEIYWDMDPRVQPGMSTEPGGLPIDPPVTFISAAPLAWMNLFGLVVGVLGLILHLRAGGRLHKWSTGLVMLGFAVSLYHANVQIDDLVRCTAWASAAALGLAVFHLSQRPAQRNIFIAGLVSLIIPLTIRSVWYVLVEQPQVVRQLEASRDQLLRAHGWDADSSMALQYIRRAEAIDATGTFGLSNVHGSLMAALSLLALASVVTLWVRRRWRFAWLPGILAAGGLFTVALSRSKGAAIAVALCSLLCLLIPWMIPTRKRLGDLLPFVATLLIFAAMGGVLIRGAMGNPSSEKGERSVLFRYHYWQGTLRMTMDNPARILTLGTGPTGFQERYLRFKLPISPEDVTSNHNVFVDFVVMLGIGGIAWSLLMLYWVTLGARATRDAWRTAPPATSPQSASTAAQTIPASSLAIGAGLALPAFAVNYFYQSPTFLPEVALMFVISAMAFVVVSGIWTTPSFELATGRSSVVGCFLAGLILLIHNQVEMSFFHLGASPVLWTIMGLGGGVGWSMLDSPKAGPVALSSPTSAGRLDWFIAATASVAMVGAAVYLAMVYALPVTAQDHHLHEAFRALRLGDRPAAIVGLDRATKDVPTDYRVYRSKAGLQIEEAYAAMDRRDLTATKRILDETGETFDAATKHGLDDSPLIRNKASYLAVRANLLGSRPDLLAAIATARDVCTRVPYDPTTRTELAKLLAQAGEIPEAIEQYREALGLSDQAYLDSLRQFTPRERARIEAQIAELEKHRGR